MIEAITDNQNQEIVLALRQGDYDTLMKIKEFDTQYLMDELIMDHLFIDYSTSTTNNNIESILHVLTNCDNLQARDELGDAIIHYACDYGSYEIIKFLVEQGIDLDSIGQVGNRPIHYAIQRTDLRIAKIFIEKGVDLECTNNRGLRPIHFAARYYDPTKLLIEHNVNLECVDNEGQRPIHIAAQYSDTNLIKLFIDKKVNFECVDKKGNRPIHYACSYSNASIVELLVNYGCSLEVVNNKGHTLDYVSNNRYCPDKIDISSYLKSKYVSKFEYFRKLFL